MKRSVTGMVLALLAFFLLVGSGVVRAADQKTREPDVESRPVQVKLQDLQLVDQNGKKVRFRSDVIGDKLVAIDVFFSTCGLVCPILSAIFADLQDQLGDRLGRDVLLVSITVDPKTDVPRRLKEYATRWDAKPGWIFLTGEKHDVDRVLEGIGAYTVDFASHPTMILVGDGRSGDWTRFYGFATPDQVMGRIRELTTARQTKTP